ncbi:MAG: alpha/beta hydrolase [Anaerolineales bacterium]
MKTSPFHPFRSLQAQKEYHAFYMERSRAWPVKSETKLIETPSGQTFVRISGESTNLPLVLLPGSLATSLAWVPNIAALSSRHKTYALDSIYDFGLSVRRRKIKNREDIIAWLDEVLTVLIPTGTFNLMGLSYGGWVASQYALCHPERLHKLVLLAPAMTVLPVSLSLIFRALLTRIPFAEFHRRFYYWLLHDAVQGGSSGQAFVDEAVTDWKTAEKCFSPMPVIPATLLNDEAWQSFKIPVLFMVGENEKMYPAQKAVSRLNRVAPRIETEVIPRVGHDLTFTQAELVNGRILDFLENH